MKEAGVVRRYSSTVLLVPNESSRRREEVGRGGSRRNGTKRLNQSAEKRREEKIKIKMKMKMKMTCMDLDVCHSATGLYCYFSHSPGPPGLSSAITVASTSSTLSPLSPLSSLLLLLHAQAPLRPNLPPLCTSQSPGIRIELSKPARIFAAGLLMSVEIYSPTVLPTLPCSPCPSPHSNKLPLILHPQPYPLDSPESCQRLPHLVQPTLFLRCNLGDSRRSIGSAFVKPIQIVCFIGGLAR